MLVFILAQFCLANKHLSQGSINDELLTPDYSEKDGNTAVV